jgi:Tfp pilus assembly protein PilV
MNTSRTKQAGGRKGKRRGLAPTLAHLGRAAGSQEGVGLVEVLVAVAILGMTVVALLAALSTGSIGVATKDEQVTAANLARSQLEYTRSQPYADLYETVTPPAGYAVSVQADSVPEATSVPGADPSTIQKITVTVTRNGETLLTVDDFKVDR